MERPFRTAAPHYARYRPAYPAELIRRIAQATGVDGTARVLDLGCGPGSLAIPLASYAKEVVAVDVEPEMIAELRRDAPSNVTAITGRAEDVDESWGRFRLATAGRSFTGSTRRSCSLDSRRSHVCWRSSATTFATRKPRRSRSRSPSS